MLEFVSWLSQQESARKFSTGMTPYGVFSQLNEPFPNASVDQLSLPSEVASKKEKRCACPRADRAGVDASRGCGRWASTFLWASLSPPTQIFAQFFGCLTEERGKKASPKRETSARKPRRVLTQPRSSIFPLLPPSPPFFHAPSRL